MDPKITGLILNPKIGAAPNQYKYPGITLPCDPLCAGADTLQNEQAGGPCKQTVCIMDDSQINTINSNCTSATISQTCGSGSSGNSICYMSNVGINTINSTCGKEVISQYCGSCFEYDPSKGWAAKKVDCSNPSGQSDSGGTGGSGGSGSSGSATSKSYFSYWFKAHPFYATGLIVFIIVLLFIIIYFGFT